MDPFAVMAQELVRRQAAERFGDRQGSPHRDHRRRGDGVVRARRVSRRRAARRRLRGLAEALLR